MYWQVQPFLSPPEVAKALERGNHVNYLGNQFPSTIVLEIDR